MKYVTSFCQVYLIKLFNIIELFQINTCYCSYCTTVNATATASNATAKSGTATAFMRNFLQK